MKPRTSRWFGYLLVFALSVLPFIAAFSFPSINIDDPDYYTVQRAVTDGLTVRGFVWALTDLSNAIWMPLTWLCYQFDHSLRALLVAVCPELDGYRTAYAIAHIQSIILHGANAVLLFTFFVRLANRFENVNGKKAILASLVAAVAWGVHPLRVESVVWIASFKDVLSQTFLLLAIMEWMSYRERGGVRMYLIAHLLFLLACCAKPTAMSYPGIVFLLDALILGKFTFKGLTKVELRVYMPSVIIAVCVAVLAHHAQSVGNATVYQSVIPFHYKLLNSLTSLGVYLRNGVWPTKLAAQCQIQWPKFPHDFFCGMFLGLAILCAALRTIWCSIRELRTRTLKNKLTCAGILWFIGSMFPMLGLSAFGAHAFADRFTYLPFVGLSMILLGVLLDGGREEIIFGTSFIGILLLGMMTARQTSFWENDEKLMLRTLQIDGDRNIIAHVNLARFYYEHQHDVEGISKAVNHMKRVFELDPTFGQSSAVLYMMMLGENGEGDNLPKIESSFVRWLQDVKGIKGSIDQDIAEGLTLLYSEKTGLSRERRFKRVKELTDELLAMEDQRVSQIDYFLYLAGQVMGDRQLQETGLQRLQELAIPYVGQDHAVRFRFLTSKQ